MSAEKPGSVGHTEITKAALAETEYANRITPETPVRIGSKLHRAAIDPRIKPGTRAYREHMLRTATGAAEEPLDPRPWGDMNRHSQIDDYVEEAGIERPEGWDAMKIADKQTWLDGFKASHVVAPPVTEGNPGAADGADGADGDGSGGEDSGEDNGEGGGEAE